MTKPKVAPLKFEDPPPRQDRRYDWASIATQLRIKPGQWAKVFDNDRASLATAIRIDGIKALRADKGFVVRTTNNTREYPRTCSMYLKYEPELDQGRQDT